MLEPVFAVVTSSWCTVHVPILAGSPASLAPQGCAAVLSFSRERVLDHAMRLKKTKKLNRQIIEKIRTERQRERGKE